MSMNEYEMKLALARSIMNSKSPIDNEKVQKIYQVEILHLISKKPLVAKGQRF